MITFLQHHLQPHKGAPYRERGMTLIEVVIAIAIMGVIVGAVYGFLIFANRETRAAGTKEEVVEEVNLFFLRVSQDIRNAKKCEIIDSNHTLKLSNGSKITYEWDSSSHSIRRKVEATPTPTPTVTPTPMPTVTPTPTPTPPPMVKDVTYANFNRDANKINIEVKVEVVAGGREQEQTFSTVVTCRN